MSHHRLRSFGALSVKRVLKGGSSTAAKIALHSEVIDEGFHSQKDNALCTMKYNARLNVLYSCNGNIAQ